MRNFTKSLCLQKKFHSYIPGGSHTYAKGDDQYPEFNAPIIEKGKGCRVWDVDGNEYIEYGMGLRAVGLGHAYNPVNEAACKQMAKGSNFTRPAIIEVKAAEAFLAFISGAEMVKFAKNGSDATTAATKLARAYTGRDLIALCGDHPFFSTDDWFIGATAINTGIPEAVRSLSVTFKYNDIESARQLFERYPNQIACLILEAERDTPPLPGYLKQLKELCHTNGALFILDEMITGFRWHNGGAQTLYDIVPDLSTFGKAMGNGFAVSALAGKREFMEMGGLYHEGERVFLLSTTHGAESHALAAAIAVMDTYEKNDVIGHMKSMGERLQAGLKKSIAEYKLEGYVGVHGHPASLYYSTCDQQKQRSQPYRTLLLQELVQRGILAPNLVMSWAHQESDIDQTINIFHDALAVYRKAIDEDVDKYLVGKSVKPVYRRKN